MNIKELIDLKVETLVSDDIIDNEDIKDLENSCGINNGTGTCGD
ncbi:hypothetical protein [Haloimpatiens massiliensis]|nr:hypothetical protein [Haloimpatiens massiliensis]